MDIAIVAGTVSTVVFAVSNLPMLRKALRTRDVSSYSLSSLVMINAANALYSLYVFTLPVGPIWALHSFYVVSCAIMLVLCIAQRRAGRNEAGGESHWPGAAHLRARGRRQSRSTSRSIVTRFLPAPFDSYIAPSARTSRCSGSGRGSSCGR
jgi:uncharacterized protein with PQ loop repeat